MRYGTKKVAFPQTYHLGRFRPFSVRVLLIYFDLAPWYWLEHVHCELV